ncbi:MAG: glycoside hydrolase [Actinobacteria bacterium]|nr:glycoside hydrolase [Actinomycetota bacterium]
MIAVREGVPNGLGGEPMSSSRRDPRTHARRAFGALILVILTIGPPGRAVTAGPADPGAGTIGPDNPEVTWDGQHFAAMRTFFGPDLCSPERDPDNVLCDHFTLTVDVEPSYWEAHEGGARVSVEWEQPSNRFHLHVFRDGEVVASSVTVTTRMNEVVIPRASGTYEVRVTPEVARGAGYVGTATFVSQEPGANANPSRSYHGVRTTGAVPDEEPQSTPTGHAALPPRFQIVDVGRNAQEPTIGVDPTGTAFYAAVAVDGVTTPAPGQTRTRLLRSTDDGLVWQDISPALAPDVAAHQFTFDPFVYVEDQSGRVFLVDLTMIGSQVSFSDDGGETFETVHIDAVTGIDDRPSLTSGPVPEGVPRPTLDPAFPEIVYYCVNHITHTGCFHSLDGGRTFLPTGEPPFAGVNTATGALCSAFTGDVQTDVDGRVLLPRITCVELADEPGTVELEVPEIAVSEDAGATWTRSVVSETVLSGSAFSQVAADADGNLFYVWIDARHRLPYLATSTDHGVTWSDPLMFGPPGLREAALPTIVAGDRGRIAVTFIGSRVSDETDFTRPWDSYVVMSTNALDEDPLFVSTMTNPRGDPVYRGECSEPCAGFADFLDIQLSPLDGSVWVTAVDACTRIEACTTDGAPGVVHLTGEDGAVLDSRGIAIRQVAGPALAAGP